MKYYLLIFLLVNTNSFGQIEHDSLKIEMYKTWLAKYIRFDDIKPKNLNLGKFIVESDLEKDTTITINKINFLLLASTSKIESHWLKPLLRNNGIKYFSIKHKVLSVDTIDIFTEDLNILVKRRNWKFRLFSNHKFKYSIHTHMNSCKGEFYISDGRFIYDSTLKKWNHYKIEFDFKENRFKLIKT